MKRVLSILLAVLMLMSVTPISAFADGCAHEYDFDCDSDCNLCGEWRDVEHTWVDVGSKPATCTEDGLRMLGCQSCGVKMREIIPALGHAYDNDADPDCNYCGEKREVEGGCAHEYERPCATECYLCGELREAEHSWVLISAVEPTCISIGLYRYNCEWCGEPHAERLPVIDHTYDNDADPDCNYCGQNREVEGECPHKYTVKVLMAATCAQGGLKRYTCAMCGDSYEESTPATGEHVYDDDFDADCNNCGEVREVEGDCQHAYDHPCATECYLCGAIREVEHAWYLVNATEPTCSTVGLYRYKCELCGEPYMESIPATGEHVYDDDSDSECNVCGEVREIEVHVHEWIEKSSKPATCTEDGQTTLYCPGCGIVMREIVPALGHAYDNDADPDCNNCGEKREVEGECAHEYKTPCDNYCYKCGEWREAGHVYQTTADIAPPCAEHYVKEYVCMNCGHSYSQVMTPSQDHVYDDDSDSECNVCGEVREIHVHEWMEKSSKPATCTEDGQTTLYCPGCGIVMREIVPALGHAYDNDADPDCNNCGEKREVEGECAHEYDNDCDADCNLCGESRATNGHVYDVTVVEPTCNVAGYTTYVCEICGHKYTTKIPATGHEYESTMVDATCTAEGYELHTCIFCGDSYKDNFIPVRTEHGFIPGDEFLSCTEQCYTEYFCLYCGYSYREYREPTGHLPQEWPTIWLCKQYTYCGNPWCNEILIPATGHLYTEEVERQEPTCTEDGYILYCCYGCPTYEKTVLPTTGHEYTVTVFDPTCTAEGYTTHTCARCGNSYQDKVIPALGHAYDSDFDPDCNHCGERRNVLVPHIYGAVNTDSVNWGDTFTLSVMLENNPGLVGWQVSVAFNENVLDLVDWSVGTTFPAGGMSFGPGESPFTATFADFIHPDVTANGLLYTLTFRVKTKAPAGATVLEIYTTDAQNFTNSRWEDIPTTFTDASVTVLEHAHTYTATVVKPTCDTPGYTTYVCKACGDSYTEPTPAQGHKYAVAVVEPTCTADGYTLYACTACDNSYRDKVIPAFGHAYDDVYDATCNYCGEIREVACPHAYKDPANPVCVLCGKAPALSDKLTVYSAADNAQLTRGDEFTVSVLMKNNPGLIAWRIYVAFDQAVLELVSQTRGDVFPAGKVTFGPLKSPTNAMFTDAINPDVEGDGVLFTLTFRVLEDAPFGTSLLDVYLADPMDFYNQAWDEFEIDTLDTAVVVTDHVHTYDGICDGVCNICGFTRPAAEHAYDNACDAVCNGCGLVREVKPHAYTVKVVDPTCEGEGTKTSVCSICGHTVKETIPALGHDYTVTVFAPDCVNDGYTLHSCNRCRYSYTDEIVPALGHKPGAAADCVNPQLCTVCGIQLNPALGHAYEAVVTAPTCTAEGYTTHTCTRCGDCYVDSIVAALGHAYEGVVTAPTCTAEGYTTYTCATCGDGYVDDVVAALGHSYDNACDAACNACGETREVPDHVYDHEYDATCNECGDVREIPFIPGDVDDNGTVNVRDYGRFQQYLNGFEVAINLAAANVDGNSSVNVRDLGRLQQYLNGWDVTLGA